MRGEARKCKRKGWRIFRKVWTGVPSVLSKEVKEVNVFTEKSSVRDYTSGMYFIVEVRWETGRKKKNQEYWRIE